MMKVVIILLTLLTLNAGAQVRSDFQWQADLLSRHYWRGFVFGDMPAIEPQATISKGRFSLNLWAAYALNESYAEIDIIPSFQMGNFELIFFDYYNPVPGEVNRYTDFSDSGNRHSGEVAIKFNGSVHLPLTFLAGTFLYGDSNPATGNAFFSTYLEMGYLRKLGGFDTEVSLGVTPARGYYNDRLSLVHAGIAISNSWLLPKNLSIPVQLSVNGNPARSNIWIILSVGIGKNL